MLLVNTHYSLLYNIIPPDSIQMFLLSKVQVSSLSLSLPLSFNLRALLTGASIWLTFLKKKKKVVNFYYKLKMRLKKKKKRNLTRHETT